MTTVADSHSFWLLDACALTPVEIDSLRQAGAICWMYDRISDERAASVGPVLVGQSEPVDEVIDALKHDEARAWAVSALHAKADFGVVSRHFMNQRYLRTQDGQRYFLRYADSRCLVAIWSVMNRSQQVALLGPVHRWTYTDRQGLGQSIHLDGEQDPDVHSCASGPIRLNNEQLGHLLERSLPDQLLHSVTEKQVHMGQELTSWQRYVCARRVCDWLLKHREERYPVQLAMLMRILLITKPDWDDAQWAASLLASHQASVEACA